MDEDEIEDEGPPPGVSEPPSGTSSRRGRALLRSRPMSGVVTDPRPAVGSHTPASGSEVGIPAGRSLSKGPPVPGFHWELDLSSIRLEDWLAHLGIYDALDPYFPSGRMREEDIARAYAQLLTLHQSLRAQVARAERQSTEGEVQQVRFNVERERALKELERVQEDLSTIMARLSLGKPDEGDSRRT